MPVSGFTQSVDFSTINLLSKLRQLLELCVLLLVSLAMGGQVNAARFSLLDVLCPLHAGSVCLTGAAVGETRYRSSRECGS